MTISAHAWNKYVATLSRINEEAARQMGLYLQDHGYADTQALIDYAYALTTKYGEASSAMAAEMYDAMAALMKQNVPPAAPAPTATYDEVTHTVTGVLNQSQNPSTLTGAVERLVKQAGEDTILQNAARDGALVAWIPNGDTCAFCIALAANGWQQASAKLMKNGHAKHVHANCDCTHAVTWDPFDTKYASYDPDRYREMYDSAGGSSSRDKINSLRRAQYAQNKDRINEQKRAAYKIRTDTIIGAEKERLLTSYPNTVQTSVLDAPDYVAKFMGITGIESVDTAIYNSATEILDHRKGTNYEDLHLIDAKTGEVIHKLTTCNLVNEVKYDTETLSAIERAHQEHRSIIAIHNHPGGLPPTLDDGVSAYDHSYAGGVAVGHNMEVYMYGAADGHYNRAQCDAVHEIIAEEVQFSVAFDDAVWYDELKNYGMEVLRR